MADDESTPDWQARVNRDGELLAKALYDSVTDEADPDHIGPETKALVKAQTDQLLDAVLPHLPDDAGEQFAEITARLGTAIGCLAQIAAQCARGLEAMGRPVQLPERFYPPDIVPPDAG
jgi:hypothetical protein